MCIKLVKLDTEKYDVLYSGIRVWTKRDQLDKYEYFFKKILDNGKMPQFQAKADGVFNNIDDATFEILKRDRYGFDFYDSQGKLLPKNNDIFDFNNDILARLSSDEIETFIRFHKLARYQKTKALNDTVLAKLLNSKNVYNPSAIGKIQGELVPASRRGLGPNFDHPDLEKFLYAGDLRNARIKIKMSGRYDEDFRRAFQAADVDITDPELEYFVWHHLDDLAFDQDGVASCTMQLVSKYLHDQIVLRSPLTILGEEAIDTIVAGRHIGSVALWEALYMLKFK